MCSPLRVQWIGLDVGRNTHGHRGLDWIGLGQSAGGLGWIGFSKMDPCPTLCCILYVKLTVAASLCFNSELQNADNASNL